MPPLQTSDESHASAGLAGRLPDGYPPMLPPADGSRLGRMLARLSAAFEAAAVAGSVQASLRTDLIDLVPRLRRYAAALTADPAEADDLVQSTLLRAWEKREHLPTGPALAAWLFAVLRRTFLHERRRGAGRTPEEGATEGEGTERHAMREALDRLTWAQREALLLVTVEGLSQEAASAIIGCSADAVRERLDEAHDRLARDLGV